MNIRDYQASDIPEMLAVIKAAFAEYQGRLDPPSSAERKTVAIMQAELAEANALVAVADDTVVGCVFYRPQGDGIYLDRLAVLPTYRRQGIAGALLNAVEQKAVTAGHSALYLSVRLVLTEQQAFYQQRGFVVHAYDTHEGYAAPTSIKMRKALA